MNPQRSYIEGLCRVQRAGTLGDVQMNWKWDHHHKTIHLHGVKILKPEETY